jgi:hypothetical protein
MDTEMAYRTFLDDNGRYWQVWESHPHIFERRKSERRVAAGEFSGVDRRKSSDRRQGSRTRSVFVDPRLASGWLTFESFTEKRRLAPIPPHWDEMSVRDLIGLWERANPVSRIGDESSAA